MSITTAFILISILIFNLVVIFIPKNLKADEFLSCSVFVMFLQLIVDVVLDLKYDIYGYFKRGIDLEYFIPLFGVFPAFTIIMLNYYPYKKAIIYKILYIIGVSIFCLTYEWLSLKAKYLYHNGWTFGMSAIAYPILITIIVFYLRLIRKLKNTNQ